MFISYYPTCSGFNDGFSANMDTNELIAQVVPDFLQNGRIQFYHKIYPLPANKAGFYLPQIAKKDSEGTADEWVTNGAVSEKTTLECCLL